MSEERRANPRHVRRRARGSLPRSKKGSRIAATCEEGLANARHVRRKARRSPIGIKKQRQKTWCARDVGYQLYGAGEGNRTLIPSLGSLCSAIELHPRATPPEATTER